MIANPAIRTPRPSNEDVFTDIGNARLTPVSLRRIFLLLTRSHFSDAAHYGPLKEKLANYVWSAEAEKCKLYIDLDYEYDPKNLDRRPAIFVGCDDFIYTRVAINNAATNKEDNSGRNYVKNGATNIIIRHIAKTPDDSLQLSDQTCDFFDGIQPLMQEKVRFKQYLVSGQKASRPFERAGQQSDQQFMVDVTISLQFNVAWCSLIESHRVKKIRLNFNPRAPVVLPVNS